MEPEVKTCCNGGHPIADDARYTAYYNIVDGEVAQEPTSYECGKHASERRIADFLQTRTLTTGLIVEASLDRDRRRRALGIPWDGVYNPSIKMWYDHFMADCDRVDETFKLWEREVWFGGQAPHLDDTVTEPYPDMPEFRQYIDKKKGAPAGSLQAFVIPAKRQGYKAEVDGTTYLSYTIAGRSIFQIDRGDVSIGYCLDETSPTPRGGVQSLSCTADQAVALITRAISDWKEGKIVFQPSDKVGF